MQDLYHQPCGSEPDPESFKHSPQDTRDSSVAFGLIMAAGLLATSRTKKHLTVGALLVARLRVPVKGSIRATIRNLYGYYNII